MDLHGHSRKHNVFTYGCGSNKGDHDQFLNERIFPFLLSRQVLCSIILKLHMILRFVACDSFPTCSLCGAASSLFSVVRSQLAEWWLGGWGSAMHSHSSPHSVGAHWDSP